MSLSYIDKLTNSYSEKIKSFLSAVESIKAENLPEPFLPVIGENYGVNLKKILFYGWETRNAENLTKWIGAVKESNTNAFTWFQEEFEELAFVKWRSNFNSDFWSFNLRFLGKFYDLPDWRELYRNPNDFYEILSSFAWANAHSIERYEVTAKTNKASEVSWNTLKEASLIFDDTKLILGALDPDLVIFQHWDAPEDWLLKGLEVTQAAKPLEFLWYYKVDNPHTYLFWIPHPRGYNRRGLSPQILIDAIISIYLNQ